MKPLLFILTILTTRTNAQCLLKTVSLGNFKTVAGTEIKNCALGYRTLGKLNAAKSNTVLWPTWFTGKSEDICMGVGPMVLDTAGLYIIVVDALGNGVSSSPSNNQGFPEITIRDMVNSEHELLIKHLGINHLKAVMGVSMGGMQALEWSVSYPAFFDKLISIVGTPQQSVYDLILWKSEAALLDSAAKYGNSMATALNLVSNIHLLNLYSPSYWLHSSSPEKVDSLMLASQASMAMKPADLLSQLKAMISHDIYKSSGKTIADIKDVIQAKVLFIVFKADHMVNPASSVKLSQALGARLVELDSDCGHMGVLCDSPHVREQVINFLKQ